MSDEKLSFRVAGDSGDDYTIKMTKDGDSVSMVCECLGSHKGQICKHRVRLLDGDFTAIKNKKVIEAVSEMIASATDLREAREDIEDIEKQIELMKKELSRRKKKLAKLMLRV